MEVNEYTYKRITTLSLILICCISLSNAYAENKVKRWWANDNEGWFFYKDPIIEKEKDIEKEKETPIHPPASVPNNPETEELFTEKMNQKGQEFLSKAMQFPTSENIQNYMMWNKFMMDMSSNFAVAWQKELMQNPYLSNEAAMADSVKDIAFHEKSKKNKKIITDLAQKAGLFFFYTSTCPYCKRQVQHLKDFADTYGYEVKAVSLDGGILPELPNSLMDNGISLRLGINKVPAIFLAFPDENRFERLSAGIVTFSQLKQRVLNYAKEIENNIDYSSFIN